MGIRVIKDVLDVVYATELYNKCIDMPVQRTSLDTWKDYLTDSKNAPEILLNDLIKLLESGKETFALRKQDKLNREQALYLSSCRSTHRDISLYF